MAKVQISKMQKARDIVSAAYANADSSNPRKDAITTMMTSVKKGGLNMKATTAATYHGHCITYFREQDQAAALKKAEAGKPVWSAFKLDGKENITSVGIFLTQKAAKAFNSDFRHDGVAKGIQTVGKSVVKTAKAA